MKALVQIFFFLRLKEKKLIKSDFVVVGFVLVTFIVVGFVVVNFAMVVSLALAMTGLN